MNKTDLLRSLPSVDDLLRLDQIAKLKSRCAHQQLVQWIRESVDGHRQKILAGETSASSTDDIVASIVSKVEQRAESDGGQSLQRVINATGIMLHTNLGRAPLAQRAIDRVNEATAFTNVELDLATGKRSKRGKRAMGLLSRLTGADDAIVVNNCAAATMLVLQAVAGGQEVIISRGQLVEIGGGFRLPNVFKAAGVVLREVGTTNRTYLRDYEEATSEETGAIIRVHHSNFRLTGFVTEPSISEMMMIQRPADIPIIDDVGSGCIGDLTQYGVTDPSVLESVAAGADLTLFSGDKLFGGPQCGIVIGKQAWIDKLRGNPLMRAMRVDKMTLAALEATTEIHLAGDAAEELPLMQMLTRSVDAIRAACEQIVSEIGTINGIQIQIVQSESRVGGGSVPGVEIRSAALRISGCRVNELAHELRSGETAIQARVSDDSLWLDLRTVPDADLDRLTVGLKRAIVAVCGSSI